MSLFNLQKFATVFKLFLIGVLVLLFLIPTYMVLNLVHERQGRQSQAAYDISQDWGGTQSVVGPVLRLPYSKTIEVTGGKETVTSYAYFLPETLKISGDVTPNVLRRGIYKIVSYDSKLRFEGEFSVPDLESLKIKPESVDWNDARVLVGIADVRGINDEVSITWQEQDHVTTAGSMLDLVTQYNEPAYYDGSMPYAMPMKSGVKYGGVNAVVTVNATQKSYIYSFDLGLKGSERLDFVPVGKTTEVRLASAWANPSFVGAFLPDERDVRNDGFNAYWKVLGLNRNFTQSWTASDQGGELLNYSFGTNFLLSVDEYQKTERAIKYAILLITLTFLIFFFVEVKNKIQVHPIHYILVGLALVLFFVLLLALSEHWIFNGAYVVAALATLGLISTYSRYVLKEKAMAMLCSLILLMLYMFIFVIIQLQDYALLVGSIGLFLILSVVMYLSKGIDWYGENN